MFSSRIDAWFERNLSHAAHMTDYTVEFLLMELESVGNIRLEEGCPTDRWYRIILFINAFENTQDPPEGLIVLSQTGSLPVAISCCPAFVSQTLWFMGSLGLRSIEWSASTTML